MTKALKIIGISLGVLVVLSIAGYFILQNYLTGKIEDFLKHSLPETVSVEYGSIDLSLWDGTLDLKKLKVQYVGEHTAEVNAMLNLDELAINDVGFLEYFIKDRLTVGAVQLQHPQLVYYHNKDISKEHYASKKKGVLYKVIDLETIKLAEGSVKILDRKTDSLLFQTERFNLGLNEVVIDGETLHEKIPFSYQGYDLDFKDLFFQMNDFENIEIETGEVNQDQMTFGNLTLYTKYRKKTMDQMISKERDHFHLDCDSIQIQSQEWGFNADDRFYFRSPQLTVVDPDLKVYRNKLLPDDPKIKKLYSESIRNLKFNLDVEEVLVKNAHISYTEKVKADNQGGVIFFNELDATIQNLGNTYQAPDQTVIDVEAKFLKDTPLQVKWTFDVNNTSDAFMFHADLGHLKASQLNQFTQPNMHVKVEGELDHTVFTMYGNAYHSNIDLKIKYDRFDVVALKKNGQEKNKFLSKVIHLFVNNGSQHHGEAYRKGSKKDVERDRTKSVFNFIWKTTQAALIKAMVLEK